MHADFTTKHSWIPHSRPPYLPSDLSATPALSVRLPASTFPLSPPARLSSRSPFLPRQTHSQTATAALLPSPSHNSPPTPQPSPVVNWSPPPPPPPPLPPPHPGTGSCRASTPLVLLFPASSLTHPASQSVSLSACQSVPAAAAAAGEWEPLTLFPL